MAAEVKSVCVCVCVCVCTLKSLLPSDKNNKK